MDWSAVKNAIGTIAPWLAGTFGTPVAGVAVKAVCDVLGLSSSDARPDNMVAALAGATPEQLLALKQADIKHQEFMAQLGFDQISKLEALAVDDRKSAREMQIGTKALTVPILAYIIVGSFVAMVATTLGGLSHVDGALAGTLVGYLSAKCEQVIGFYFGSSASSEHKTALLAQAQPVNKA